MTDFSNLYPSMAEPVKAEPQTTLVTTHDAPAAGGESSLDRLYPSMAANRAVQQPAEVESTDAAPSMVAEGKEVDDTGEAAPWKINVPVDIQALREDDGARRMFTPESMYKSDIPDDLFPDSDGEFSVEVKTATVRELREMAADWGLSSVDVRTLQSRAHAIQAEPPSEGAQKVEAMRRLETAYGVRGAQHALTIAKQLLNRDLRTKNLIGALQLGNDPDTIMVLVQAARREQGKGRLK